MHAATDVAGWVAAVERFAVPIAAERRRAGAAFGLGTWWNAKTVARLREEPAVLEEVCDVLARHGLAVWTVNAFPYGAFHGEAVKTAVYRPDWASEERVLFTRNVAEVVARLASGVVPISTLPLGYEPGDLRVMARNLVRAASHLAAMEARHGVHMVLALEPEPFCLLETVAQAIEFLEEWVFRTGAWTVEEATLRRHVGVCVDLCHLAVVREDPVAAVAELATHGIACAKIQVSACLELRDATALDALLAYDEPVYLHQTVGDTGARALDLTEVAARRAEFLAAGVLRTHFHTPVFWDTDGGLGSTRAELVRVLRALPRPLPLLEVETYTWHVLPDRPTTDAALVAGILEELAFVQTLA